MALDRFGPTHLSDRQLRAWRLSRPTVDYRYYSNLGYFTGIRDGPPILATFQRIWKLDPRDALPEELEQYMGIHRALFKPVKDSPCPLQELHAEEPPEECPGLAEACLFSRLLGREVDVDELRDRHWAETSAKTGRKFWVWLHGPTRHITDFEGYVDEKTPSSRGRLLF